jgi:methylated-DNA-[protein]-cysteine S-methyltransferase
MTFHASIESPLGPIALTSDGEHLTDLHIGRHVANPTTDPIIDEASAQLGEYFAGHRTEFDLPLKASGTAFQESIWRALQGIPFGHTTSYGRAGPGGGKTRLRPGCRRSGGGKSLCPL